MIRSNLSSFRLMALFVSSMLFYSPFLFSQNQNDQPAALHFYWEDEFSNSEKQKIETWLTQTSEAVQLLLGNYPFELNYKLYRSSGNEPVPWAETIRHGDQGVEFHVNPKYSLNEFLRDWTAPHEISHLSLPFLGRSNAWFAEGYATYMQEWILVSMGEKIAKEAENKITQKQAMARDSYMSQKSFVEVSDSLKSHHGYPQMYWGSTTYFDRLDQHLQTKMEMTLPQLIQRYLKCCRHSTHSLDEMVEAWDTLLNTSYCQELLTDFETLPAKQLWSEVEKGQE